jgi:hypothetical protein
MGMGTKRGIGAALLALCVTACEEGPPPSPSALPPDLVGSLPDAGPARVDMFMPEVPEPEPERCEPGDFDIGPSVARRMTRAEYDHTIRDLLGDDSHPARGFAREEEMLGFDNNAQALQVTPLHAEQYLDAAETLAARAAPHLVATMSCLRSTPGCDAQFVRELGLRAWRRPLTDDEVARLTGLFGQVAELEMTGDPFTNGVQLVVEAMLQSPNFLYRIEVGREVEGRPGLRLLDGYEVASRLSYLLWQSMPDDVLFAAAAAGELDTSEGVAVQARRLLDDPRAHEGLQAFFDQWLRLDEIGDIERDPAYYPEFTPELRALWHEESRRLLEHLVFSGESTLGDLLDAPYTFVNGPLAAFYGIPGVTGDAWVKVDLDGTKRNGLLTQASILALTAKAAMTSPVFRGKFVREQLLCTPIPPPPPDIVVVPPDPDPHQSTRDIFREHSANPVCANCHRLMDPIGFGFESFDAIGRWRDRENGFRVDDAGEVTHTLDVDGQFRGAAELGRKLANSAQVQRCVTRQLFRYAFGRGEVNADRCTLEELFHQYVSGGQDFRTLLVEVVKSDAFRYRKHVEAEGDAP